MGIMNKADATLIASMLNDQACYGGKEHPVRLMTLHDCAESWRMVLGAHGPSLLEAFNRTLDLPAVPSEGN